MLRVVGLLCLLIACFTIGSSRAQSDAIGQYKKSVVFLFGQVHVRGPNGEFLRDEAGTPILVDSPLGTGFFVWYPDARGGEDFGFCYLVTANHVLKDVNGKYLPEVRVRLNLANQEGSRTERLPVAGENGQLLGFGNDEDAGSDIAVLPFLPDLKKTDFKMIPKDLFADDEFLRAQMVEEGDSVYSFGLMPQYYGESRNYPVVRRGSLALLTDERIQTGPDVKQHVYLAELGSWPGNSGAPVALDLGGFRNNRLSFGSNCRLLGLMLGYLSNVQQAQLVNTRMIFGGDPSNIGISYILPASVILKALESEPAQSLRNEMIAGRLKLGNR